MSDHLDLDQPATSPDAGTVPASPAPDGRPRRRTGANLQVDNASREEHLLDYVKILYKRRHLVVTTFLLIVISVVVYTFTVTPIYQAKTRLLIEAENPNIVDFKEVINEEQAKQDYYQTQYNVLQSRTLARKTIDELQLWQHPLFASVASKASSGGLMGTVRGWFGREETVAENQIPGADETLAQSRVIDGFLRSLTVSPVRLSRLVDVRYSLPDPALAMKIANSLASNYIKQNLEYKFLASKDASDWLGDRLKEQRAQVEAAETALQRYREQNEAISLEDRQNITVQKLADLNAAVTKAKTIRIEKESLYNQLRLSQANPAQLDTFPAILTNAFIQSLKAQLADLQRQRAQMADRLGDKNPEMIKINSAIQNTQIKLDGEIQKVVQSVKSEYDAAVAQENSLTSALNQQKGEALSMNRKAIEYGVLERDVESSKQIYNSLMQRAKETDVAGELRTSNIRVVDQAEQPRSPISPQKDLNLLVALFGGVLVACGLAFFFEYLDSRIKNPDDIKAHLRLSHLGLLPIVDPKSLNGRYPLISDTVPVNFAEAFRAIRTNVLFSTAVEGARSLVVTSTGPGEGKSMVAANMAVALAQAGQRVLLVDADMRRPKVQDVFQLAQEPGLSNLLVGNAKANECVRKSSVAGLWVLPAGRIPPNPAELLGSQRWREFMATLVQHFDWIIIDSPPVMAVTDAAVIAHQATGVLFVVGAEMTSRHAAVRALDQLENAQARFIGAVLNRVDLDRNAYYYSQYYRREYAQYYTKTTS